MKQGKKKISGFYRIFLQTGALLLLVLTACSCAASHHLNTQSASVEDVQGTYRVILYGCRHPDDIKNIAILDREGDPYTIEAYAPDFEFKIRDHLPAEEALRQAEAFLHCSFFYEQSRISKITDSSGAVLGYEIRPLYSPIRFGIRDVFNIQYVKKADRIIVYIQLDPEVERFIHNQGGDNRERGGGH